VFSFYPYDPIIEVGLDPSYAFGLNYIFAQGIPFGTQVIYTYGPFGFLCFPQPIGINFILGVFLSSLFRFTFIYLLIYLGKISGKNIMWIAALLALLLCNWIYLDFVLVGSVIICLLIHFKKQIKITLYAASFLTILALLIKSSFGLMCASILGSYALYDAVNKKRLEILSHLFVSSLLTLLLIWLLLYGNFDGLFSYFVGIWQLSVGNSSAMVLEVDNNWWWLGLFTISFFSIPFFIQDKSIRLLFLIAFLSLFAAWKYAFSREENFHLKFFFDYLLLFSALVVVLIPSFKPRILALLLSSLLLFHQSMEASKMYSLEEKIRTNGLFNFYSAIFHYQDLVEDSQRRTEKILNSKVLPDTLINLIGNTSIDFFPWELSYVPANNLNWQPRPNMQSGAYTTWLDRNNANFIASKKSAKLILWHKDRPNAGVDCFDDRYLLNDEPHTIFSIFNKYKVVYSDSIFALFQKSADLNFQMILEGEQQQTHWNEWIQVPIDSSGITRIKVNFENNGLGKIRKAFYKDLIYFIDYQFEDSTQKSYRILGDNAVNGLWVNPLLQGINGELKGKKVNSLRFRNSNQKLVCNNISYNWQILTFAKNQYTTSNDDK
jgi:hypothetical protein